MFILLY